MNMFINHIMVSCPYMNIIDIMGKKDMMNIMDINVFRDVRDILKITEIMDIMDFMDILYTTSEISRLSWTS